MTGFFTGVNRVNGVNRLKAAAQAALMMAAIVGALTSTAAQAGKLQIEVSDANGKPLEDAVVFLDPASGRLAAKPMAGAEVEQVNRQFAPRVSVVTTGTMVLFPNRDTVRHHVYSFSPPKNFELKLYTGTPTNPVLFDKPGVVVLGCNIHDHMLAWVLVVDTPFHDKTDATGQSVLSAVPAGNYRLRVWHPNLPVGAPAQDQDLSVTAADASLKVRLRDVRP